MDSHGALALHPEETLMQIATTLVALTGTLLAVLVAIDMLVFLLKMHSPFTVTEESLLFVVTLGRRKPRFIARLRRSPLRLNAGEIRSLLAASSLGALFWLAVVGVTLYALSPIPQVHEWQ
jgi:hypothetical protein